MPVTRRAGESRAGRLCGGVCRGHEEEGSPATCGIVRSEVSRAERGSTAELTGVRDLRDKGASRSHRHEGRWVGAGCGVRGWAKWAQGANSQLQKISRRDVKCGTWLQ